MHDDRIYASYVRALRLRGRTEETIHLYRRAYTQLRRFTSTPLTEVSRFDLEEFFEARRAEVADSTVHKEWRNLRALFRWLAEEDYIGRDPMARVPAPEVDETLPRVLSDDELKALFRACAGKAFRDRRDLAILRVMSEVGGPRRVRSAESGWKTWTGIHR